MATVTTAEIKKVVEVASDIIYAQEGNYGSVNENDNNHGMSIGKCQWNAYWGRALPLLQTIVKANEEQARELLGDELYKEVAESKANAWNKKNRTATEEESKAISALLQTKEGKEAQDALAEKDITNYVKNGVKNGVESLKALAYYADLENQGGASTSKDIALGAGKALGGVEKVGLEEIHTYALKDEVMGKYASRRERVYNALKSCDLSDVNSTDDKNIVKEDKTENKAQNELKKGDIVTFTGGNIYTNSTAEKAAKQKKVVSRCRVTAVNTKGTHPYHCISQDGKGVYGWVDVTSIKEVSSTAQSDPKTVSKGDIVTFTGGNIYTNSTAEKAAKQKKVVSRCRVTAVNAKGTHPYHCVSQDGKGVYGWVDKENVK